ncbi:metallophosphoesterase family protein [Desulfogranum mediterraneum]|uniref:metallophosphoesterase family protein n=1 Tax=Desulfogranum mediterraneum TaxID=160661 RepID=UPI0004044545|nr:metallophosphoesterase [Desulfogranum mediterraneum]
MKILAIADTEVRELIDGTIDPGVVRGVELVLSCGDLPPEYLSAVGKRLGVPVFYILGNHDIRYAVAAPEGCLHIHRQLVSFHGVRLLGLGGSRWYNGGISQYREQQMRSYIRRLWLTLWLRRGVDIVLTHAPPRWCGDAEDPCHRGFRCFRSLIARHRPGYLLHGHIHTLFSSPEERVSWLGTTQIVNCYGYYVFQI